MYRRSFTVLALIFVVMCNTATAAADDLPRLDERTAFMIGAKRLRIGILAFDYGIIEQVSVGTDPPAWAARAFLPVFIPNLHLKAQILQREPVALALQGAAYYVSLDQQGSASGSLLAFPVSGFGSFRLHQRVWLHGELTYIFVNA